MNNKLRRVKHSPKAQQQERDDHWDRVATILQLQRPTQVDLWWSRRFLRKVVVDPMVKPTAKHPQGIDEGPTARAYLKILDKKWPEKKLPKRRLIKSSSKVGKFRKKTDILLAESAMRGLRKKLREQKKQSDYWGIRFTNMGIQNPKWMPMRDKVRVIRQEIERIEARLAWLKERL